MTTIDNDTICAISTPAGAGGIAVARISGRDAIAIADKVWRGKPLATATSHTAHLGIIADPANGDELDQAVATVFRAPGTFTGEDVVELSVHGSRFIQRELINLLVRMGCRTAEPGEFTRRAYTSGRLALTEAEAVADLIAASSRAAHRIAMGQMKGAFTRRLNELRDQLVELSALLELELDFSEEDVEFASRERLKEIAAAVHAEIARLEKSFATGTAIKEGVPVAIVGATNVGKSSLLNRLVDDDKAIVSDIHGTTRDLVEDTVEIGDILFRFIDTAGLRATTDPVESMGIERSRKACSQARIVLLVMDATSAADPDLIAGVMDAVMPDCALLILLNKADKASAGQIAAMEAAMSQACPSAAGILPLSAKENTGIDQLREALQRNAGADQLADGELLITNARHSQALALAGASVSRVISGLDTNISGDLIAQDLRETLHHLADITPAVTPAEVLASIFSRFCVGK